MSRGELFNINQKVNNWTIINKLQPRRTPKGQVKHYWLCQCKCGKRKEIYAGSLRSGKSKSCGCDRSNKKDHGEASKHNVFLCYKNRAKRKNIAFDINKEEFMELVIKPCFYCGKSDSNYMAAGKRNGGFRYNGVDRFNNNEGYIKYNCIPCCKNCNKAKLDQTHEDFLNMVKLIYERHINDK